MDCKDIFSQWVKVQGEEVWDKRDDYFEYKDKTHGFTFAAVLRDGFLTMHFDLLNESRHERSVYSGDVLYDQMIRHFGLNNIYAIEGSWSEGSNYETFLKLYNSGMTTKKAVFQTWSGVHAQKYGFNRVEFVTLMNESWEYYGSRPRRPISPALIEVLFMRSR